MISSISGSPAATTSSSGTLAGTSGAMGKEDFLKLLVTQMKNQDPLDPMKGEEFAAQLAQFSSLEQLIGINGQLQSQAGVLSGITAQSALSTLGRTVTALGDQVVVPASGEAQVTFDVGPGGGTATLHLLDSKGREVGTRDLGRLEAGRQTAELGSASANLPAGAYTYRVDVTDTRGNKVAVQSYTTGKVDGVKYGSNGPVLVCGGVEVLLAAVVSVAN